MLERSFLEKYILDEISQFSLEPAEYVRTLLAYVGLDKLKNSRLKNPKLIHLEKQAGWLTSTAY